MRKDGATRAQQETVQKQQAVAHLVSTVVIWSLAQSPDMHRLWTVDDKKQGLSLGKLGFTGMSTSLDDWPGIRSRTSRSTM